MKNRKISCVFNAGYPDRTTFRRYGRWWIRIDKYVIGDIESWDQSSAS